MSEQTLLNPSPEEGLKQMLAWGEKDLCFHVLHLLARTDGMENLDFRKPIFDLFNQHWAACGSCWPNVLMAADNDTEPFRKRVYFNVYHVSLFALMKAYGGDAAVKQEADGLRISVKYPSYMVDPWVGGEVYLPSRFTEEALIILDVRDEALFKDPRPVLQKLDEISATEVKDFDQPAGQGIQWWTIVGDRPSRLLVRWQGVTRSIADDWTLVSRYRRLVAKHDVEARLAEDLAGKAALVLRELAGKYDGRSWFPGYVKTTLEYRRKDAHRHNAKDAFGKSEGTHLDRRQAANGVKKTLRVPKRLLEEATHRSQLNEEKLIDDLDLSRRREQLEKHLTKRQRRVLALK